MLEGLHDLRRDRVVIHRALGLRDATSEILDEVAFADGLWQIEKLVDAKVHLELWVKVEPRWTKRPARVKALGYV